MDSSFVSISLKPFLFQLLIVALIAAGCIWLVAKIGKHDVIESDRLIKPEIKLIINKNKVDTVYVYRQP